MHLLRSTSMRLHGVGTLLAITLGIGAPSALAASPTKSPEAAAAPQAAESTPLAKVAALEVFAANAFAQSVLGPRKGRLVVVNFWATWCAPCVKELPEFEAAAKELKKTNVDVVLVSADGADSAKTRVPKFLKKRGVSLPVYVNADVDPEELIAVVDPDWSGALPYTVIFDEKGKRVAALPGAQTTKTIIDAVTAAQQKKKK